MWKLLVWKAPVSIGDLSGHALCDDFELILAQPAHMKAIPGQKTDKKDAHWIAKLTRIGLLPRSFVPDETIQELRELTRQRKQYNIGTFLISLLRQSKKC